ncbi:MAG: ATP-dependent DNA ligase [Dehalococcoidia bacterium]|nr:ATP-dependent DNA ligase [Dehalococcoidia bacterium]
MSSRPPTIAGLAPPIEPMLAKLTSAIPDGDDWQYEPKWDGFRALVFFDGRDAYLQSRDLKPLVRYFPELGESLARVLPGPLVLDGEVVIIGEHGLDFDALLLRIHPAESRVRKLAAETPSSFVAFDLLAAGGDALLGQPLSARRARLESALDGVEAPAYLTPVTREMAVARDWFQRFEGAGLDGVVAKRLDDAYHPGARSMLKVKHLRTVDCVIGGFRWNKGEEERSVGSLLLGLYDDGGVLGYVGHTSSFKAAEKRALVETLQPYRTDDESAGFGQGRTPGGPSRWTGDRDVSWQRLRPQLVCEVTFDHLQGERFRHAATFRRWRPDKPPRACTYDQIAAAVPYELQQIFRT